MKIATGLTLVGIGAILAFAVRVSPPGLNINIAGWVIMLTGVAGVLIRLIRVRASGWVRRRAVVRKGASAPVASEVEIDVSGEVPYPEYVLRDPAAVASAILRDAELNGAAEDDPQAAAGYPADGWADPASVSLEELLEGPPGPGSRPR
jgi:hypothetical protein